MAIDVYPSIRDRRKGWLVMGAVHYPCALGSGGPVIAKREGDGGTPIAPLPLIGGHYRVDRIRRLRSGIALTPIRPNDGWCDDPSDGRYNRPVRLPIAAGHETMCRADHLYDVVIILDWNISRRCRGRGSAIFFHLAHDDFRPTAGCIAVSARAMELILPRLTPGTVLRVRGS
ncbi:MAG: L,D-transpeptidase family protein [Pseudomonadota bacterium]